MERTERGGTAGRQNGRYIIRMRVGRALLIGLFVIALAIAGAYAYYDIKDVEDRTLDAAARAEAPGKFVELADGATHYQVSGPKNGPVVVFAAGFSVPYYIWDPLFKTVADSGFRAIRYDYYGRGWSDRVDADYTQDLYVRQLDGLLDSLDVKRPVHLAGLSYGGAIATSFADRYPERVRSIIYVDATHPGPSAASPRARSVIGWHRYMVLGGGADQLARGQLDDFFHPENYPDWVDRYRVTQKFRGTRAALRRSQLGIAAGPDQREMLAGIAERKTPVLILWGREDMIVPFEETDSLRRALPHATFVTVDSAGHLPHIEQADVVAREVVRFLRRNGGTAGRR